MFETTNLTEWLIRHGVSQAVLEILISICIVATIVSITRYVVGNRSYGIYAPIVLAIAYSYTGLRYGLTITFVVVLTSLLSYSVLRRIRMHYITRIATNYTILSIVLLAFLVFVHYYGLGLENMSNIPPLAFISIAILSDFFIKQFVKKSLKTSMATLLGTVAIAIIGWFVITRTLVSDFVLTNLWIIPALTLVNIFLGTFKGLRFKDYFRFRFNTKEDDK
ncbi:hypothetical protein GX888_02305 [Candidatus Dojkabacteria bacterium]|uniref:7 transmembrane helices usually fused to an inactive transglutaminase domain-containing protein n=1 Tax=Candidatus Dojkabacteria bacterium TaxID=2099670 RepID=A0A847VDE4_9BACT|nr:hypothetical protein [Candidatus Dojkabacteria bacterium]